MSDCIADIAPIDGSGDCRRSVGDGLHSAASCLNGQLIYTYTAANVFAVYARQQLPFTQPEGITVAWMAQRPLYLVPDLGAIRLQTMDDRRRDQRGDTDAQSDGGGLAHHIYHRAKDRHIGGGGQPVAAQSQHTAQHQSGQPEHQ